MNFINLYDNRLKKIENIEALVAQSVERQAVNLQVDCSNQSWGEFFFSKKKINILILVFLFKKYLKRNTKKI